MGYAYTNEAGMYELSIPKNGLVSIRFDTHWSLTNVTEWHPAVVFNLNIDTGSAQDIENIVLNHYLMKVGTTSGLTAEVDALAAYQLCAIWISREKNREVAGKYAKSAISRLSQMKVSLHELDEFRVKLIELFSNQIQ